MIVLKFLSPVKCLVIAKRDEYIDDGWSGTNFDRPNIKRMLQDAQAGKIDTIIVKDLSRFGRNYIQVGQYIDYIFPGVCPRYVGFASIHLTVLGTHSAEPPTLRLLPSSLV